MSRPYFVNTERPECVPDRLNHQWIPDTGEPPQPGVSECPHCYCQRYKDGNGRLQGYVTYRDAQAFAKWPDLS